MQHFTPQNRHEIRDAQPGTWAVLSSDFETFDAMRHFTPENRHEIRDAQPGTWAGPIQRFRNVQRTVEERVLSRGNERRGLDPAPLRMS